jgi:hypothetical protein
MVQAKYMQLKTQLGRLSPKAQGAFNRLFTESLPENLAKIRAERKSGYAIEKAAEPLTKQGVLRGISKRSIDDERMAALKDAEKKVPGLNIIDDLIKSGGKVKRAQQLRKLGKNAIMTAGGALGIGALGKAIRDAGQLITP